MDPINLCDKKNQINNLLQDIFSEYNRMNETKIQSKCENDLELRNMIDTIRDLEKSETEKMKQNEIQENEIRSLKKQIHEYEEMINSLQSKLEIASEEEQENNKFDMLRIQAKEITMKDREIERLHGLIKNLKEKDNKSSEKIDIVIEQVSQKEVESVTIEEKPVQEPEPELEPVQEPEPEPEPVQEPAPEPEPVQESEPEPVQEPVQEPEPVQESDKGDRLTLTYRNKKYYIYENENPQYVYEKLDNGEVGTVLGERTINPKNGRYRTKLH